jgi:hypothetical protein
MPAVTYADDTVEWQWWGGERLTGTTEKPIAFDTETELIDGPLHVPRLALAMAFDGQRLVLIHPSQVADFLQQHRSQHLVAHNLAFDFWVLHQHLEGSLTQRQLWSSVDADRWHDSLILDMLLQLATGRYHRVAGAGAGEDVRLIPANLSVAAESVGLPPISKDDPYRLRFGELLGHSVEQMTANEEFASFVDYALTDVLCCYRVYERQYRKAVEMMAAVGPPPHAATGGYQIHPEARQRFGVLTEAIQVKGSIVLAELGRKPLPIDQIARQQLEEAVRLQYQSQYETLQAEAPGLFKTYKSKKYGGAHKMTKRSLVPQMDQTILKATLQRIADEKGFPPPQSDGKLKGISTSAKAWAKLSHQHPFIEAWCGLEKWSKQLEFLQTLNAPAVYSRYQLLMRSGRTSAGAWQDRGKRTLPSLNVQQIPRDSDFRELFLAPEGKLFASVDFSYIELRTLAATCSARFGESRLRDVIFAHTKLGGLDPHEVLGMSLFKLDEEEWRKLTKDRRKSSRQRAKVASFGFPGGLGIEKFIAYAASSGVTFTRDEAKEAKQHWFDTYPEMKLWLGDRTRYAIQHQLGKAVEKPLKRLSDAGLRLVANLLRGAEQSPRATNAAWSILSDLTEAAKRWDLYDNCQDRELTADLRKITQDYVTTLTGRIRANTGYTDGANSPFQGLAADGAKLALWALRYRGYDIHIFVHDEIVVAVDERSAVLEMPRIRRLMDAAMESVLFGVPSHTEGKVEKTWAKP